MIDVEKKGATEAAAPRGCCAHMKAKLAASPFCNAYGLVIFLFAAGGIALVTYLNSIQLCVAPDNPSRLAGCTCYLDDSGSLEDCPAWNLEDPRPHIAGLCACDIVYVSVIKPYTDVTHANTCNLWWDPSSPDYDPAYFPTAKALGEKYNKRVWGELSAIAFISKGKRSSDRIAMTPYKFGEIPPWDQVRFCIGKAAEFGLVFEGLYVNFEWKGCQTDGPECSGGKLEVMLLLASLVRKESFSIHYKEAQCLFPLLESIVGVVSHPTISSFV